MLRKNPTTINNTTSTAELTIIIPQKLFTLTHALIYKIKNFMIILKGWNPMKLLEGEIPLSQALGVRPSGWLGSEIKLMIFSF